MICKLTGQEGKPAKAHIIPRSFYLINPEDKKPLKIISSDESSYPKKCPIGVWDETIVTDNGEKYFLQWDDYAYKLLVEGWDKFKVLDDPRTGKPLVYYAQQFDYHKLKLFFLSMLWRAGVSSQGLFSHVNLGPHEKRLRQLILDNDPSTSDQYSVLLEVFHDAKDRATIISPVRHKFDGVNCYEFWFGYFLAHIKVDQRNYQDPLDYIQLSPEHPLRIVPRNFWGSKENKLLKKAAKITNF